MNTVVLQQVQAARQALDEQAVKTACFILDGLLRDNAPDSPRKPQPPIHVEARQSDLFVAEMSQERCNSLIAGWVRCQRIDHIFTTSRIRYWIENESGVVLTSADREVGSSDHRPRWTRQLSRSLADLCKRGVLLKTDAFGNPLPVRCYRVARLH